MSDNDNPDSNATDTADESDTAGQNYEFLKSWPVLDTLDFDTVTVDVTQWEEDEFTVSFNFYQAKEPDEPPYSGYTLCTQIGGENIMECYMKVVMLLQLGMFDGINVSVDGTLWDGEGNEIGEIDWREYDDEVDESLVIDHGDEEDSEDKPTLH